MTPVHVAILDNQPLERQAITAQLADTSDLLLVGQARELAELDQFSSMPQPDVLLVELNTLSPAGSSIAQAVRAAEDLRGRFPDAALLILAQNNDLPLIRALMRVGVRGYLLKTDRSTEHIADPIRRIARGQTFFGQEVVDYLLKEEYAADALSPRELEALQLIAENADRTVAEIGLRMSISPNTVGNHLRSIYSKLNVSTRAGAVLKAQGLGLVSPREAE